MRFCGLKKIFSRLVSIEVFNIINIELLNEHLSNSTIFP